MAIQDINSEVLQQETSTFLPDFQSSSGTKQKPMGSPFETINYNMNTTSLGRPYDMYSKFRCLVEVWKMFNNMQSKNTMIWTTMILRHVNCPQQQHALELNLTNATGRCVVRHGCFWGVIECICQHSCTLKRVVVFMSKSLEMDGIQMTMLGVAWLTYIQSVVTWMMFKECSTRSHLDMGSFGMP